jgi:hypothetical protein
LISSTPRRRIRRRCSIRFQFVRPAMTPIDHYSKAAGQDHEKTGGFALAPQTMLTGLQERTSASSGLSNRRAGVTRVVSPNSPEKGDARSDETLYTRASRLGTNWVSHPRRRSWRSGRPRKAGPSRITWKI